MQRASVKAVNFDAQCNCNRTFVLAEDTLEGFGQFGVFLLRDDFRLRFALAHDSFVYLASEYSD